MIFTAEELGFAAKRNGMHFPEHVLDQLVIQVWDSTFDRCRHAHLVLFHQ